MLFMLLQYSVCAWGETSFGLHFHTAIGTGMTFFKYTLELFAHDVFMFNTGSACL